MSLPISRNILEVAHHQEQWKGALSDRGRITQLSLWLLRDRIAKLLLASNLGQKCVLSQHSLQEHCLHTAGSCVFAGHCQSLISSSLAWNIKQCRNSPNTELNLCKAHHTEHSIWKSIYCRHLGYSAFFIWSPVCPAMNEGLVILVLERLLCFKMLFFLLWCVAHC